MVPTWTTCRSGSPLRPSGGLPRSRCGLLDVDVLAGLQRPDGGERVPVVRRRDHDGVDVLVVEHPPQILNEPGLERRHVRQFLVVDLDASRFASMSHNVLICSIRQPRETLLQRVALTPTPMLAVMTRSFAPSTAPHAASLGRDPEELPANRETRGGRADCVVKSRRVRPSWSFLLLATVPLLLCRGFAPPDPTPSLAGPRGPARSCERAFGALASPIDHRAASALRATASRSAAEG